MCRPDDFPPYDSACEGAMMGQKITSVPDSTLERTAKDGRLSPSTRRASKRELERRGRNLVHCPLGAACDDWDCEKEHTL